MSVKEVEPQFPNSDTQTKYVTIATILNKIGKNDIIILKGLIYSLMPTEISIKDLALTFRTAKMSDNT